MANESHTERKYAVEMPESYRYGANSFRYCWEPHVAVMRDKMQDKIDYLVRDADGLNKELAEIGVVFNEGEPYNQSADQLTRRITALRSLLMPNSTQTVGEWADALKVQVAEESK